MRKNPTVPRHWSRLFVSVLVLAIGRSESTAQGPPPAGRRPDLASELDRATRSVTDRVFPLRYKLRPGEELQYEVIHQVQVKTTIDGNRQVNRSRSRAVKSWNIEAVSPAAIRFSHRLVSVNMWSETEGRPPIRYNSETDREVPTEYDGVAEMVGKPLARITINPVGHIVARDDSVGKVDMGVGEIAIPLPEQPAAIGAEWSTPAGVRVRREDGTYQLINTRILFRLESVASGVATISQRTEVLTPVEDERSRSQLVQKLTQGELQFDIDAGRILTKRLEWNETVVGFSGASSHMEYLARMSEKLIVEPRVAGAASP